MKILLLALITAAFFGGCGGKPLECTKPAIQIADMTDTQYQACKGLRYTK